MKKLVLALTLLVSSITAHSNGVNEFGWDFFQATESNQNRLFSPYSIYSCMAMTAAGARGDTLKEMSQVLKISPHFDFVKQDNLKVTNSLWIAPEFFILPSFQQAVEKEFQASITPLDFHDTQKAAEFINTAIAEQTEQKIQNLIGPSDLDPSTRLVLTNALYFSGQFHKPFNPHATSAQPFWIDAATSVEKPTMSQISTFLYGEDDRFQTVALPFEGSDIALVIALPKEKTFSQLGGENFRLSLDDLQPASVHLRLPKFTLKERLDLKQVLSGMGLTLPFSNAADFSGIDGQQDLLLSKALHEAFFAVDENGVVAAAATAVSIGLKCVLVEQPIEFNADHPFIFGLIDLATKTPLFLGELFSP